MSVDQIVEHINGILLNGRLSSLERKALLEEQALMLYKEIFPDTRMEEYHRLPIELTRSRWEPVKVIISKYENKDKIGRVVDWLATGVNLSNI